MEKQQLIGDRQKGTAADINRIQGFTRDAFDHLIGDAVEPQSGYVGFSAVKTGQTVVTVGAGRIYNEGKVFFRDDEGGVDFDFLADLPASANRIVILCAYAPPQELETVTEPREFLVNPSTRATEPRPVATQTWRRADIIRLLGNENPTPQDPPVVAPNLAFARVLLTPTGVSTVTMIDDNRLLSLRNLRNAYGILNKQFGAFGPQLETLGSDLSRLSKGLDGLVTKEAIARAYEDIARLKQTANLPDSFIDYGADNFVTDGESQTDAVGYDAKVSEGLRFPEVTSKRGLVLANPLDAGVKVTGGLMLPMWDEIRWREIPGESGEIALNSLNYDTTSIIVASMNRIRETHGNPVMVSESSSWWATAKWTDKARGLLQHDGETFQAFLTNQVDPFGMKLFRVTKKSKTTLSVPYWTVPSNPAGEPIAGFHWAQTFLAKQDMWVSAVGFHFTRLSSSGDVIVGICEVTEAGQPNYAKVLARATHTRSELVLTPGPSKLSIPPTYLQSGKQYAAFLVTGGNHYAAITDSKYQQGTLFLRTGSGFWQADPSKNLLFDLFLASFRQPRTEVLFEALNLSNGMAAIDLLMDAIEPENTGLNLEVQVAGVWRALDPDQPSPFATLPDNVPLRIVFTGTTAMQGAIRTANSELTAIRPKTAVKHISKLRTLPSPSSSIRLKARMQRFVEANHDVTLKLNVGGTEISPSVVSDRTADNGIIERTAVFSLGSPTSTFRRVVIGAAPNVQDQFVIPEITDVAV